MRQAPLAERTSAGNDGLSNNLLRLCPKASDNVRRYAQNSLDFVLEFRDNARMSNTEFPRIESALARIAVRSGVASSAMGSMVARAKASSCVCVRPSSSPSVGGKPSFAEKMLIRRAARALLRLELLDEKMSGGSWTDADSRTFGGLSNSLRLALRELGIKAQPPRQPHRRILRTPLPAGTYSCIPSTFRSSETSLRALRALRRPPDDARDLASQVAALMVCLRDDCCPDGADAVLDRLVPSQTIG